MSIEPNAKYVPDVSWRYWGIITFMQDYPGTYGMDNQREACHKELCAHYKITKEVSKRVTDNLDKYDNAVQMHEALGELLKERTDE